MKSNHLNVLKIADIAQKEADYHGPGAVSGGPAATAQSFYDKQQNFLQKADELVEKPSAAITKRDASEIQSLEVSHGYTKLLVLIIACLVSAYADMITHVASYSQRLSVESVPLKGHFLL